MKIRPNTAGSNGAAFCRFTGQPDEKTAKRRRVSVKTGGFGKMSVYVGGASAMIERVGRKKA